MGYYQGDHGTVTVTVTLTQVRGLYCLDNLPLQTDDLRPLLSPRPGSQATSTSILIQNRHIYLPWILPFLRWALWKSLPLGLMVSSSTCNYCRDRVFPCLMVCSSTWNYWWEWMLITRNFWIFNSSDISVWILRGLSRMERKIICLSHTYCF